MWRTKSRDIREKARAIPGQSGFQLVGCHMTL
jgi:hypothetical protein